MIRKCDQHDFENIWEIINDGALAYKGIIPADRWKEPYMSRSELQNQIEEGVEFWAFADDAILRGVMGIQPMQDVTLIRHAYVRTNQQKRGIGAQSLSHLLQVAQNPVLIGTWADAEWAIRFYVKHNFKLVGHEDKEHLLRRYWKIPKRQIETSVVLADSKWRELNFGK